MQVFEDFKQTRGVGIDHGLHTGNQGRRDGGGGRRRRRLSRPLGKKRRNRKTSKDGQAGETAADKDLHGSSGYRHVLVDFHDVRKRPSTFGEIQHFCALLLIAGRSRSVPLRRFGDQELFGFASTVECPHAADFTPVPCEAARSIGDTSSLCSKCLRTGFEIPVGIPLAWYHRGGRGGHPSPAPTERSVHFFRTTFGS